MTTPEITWNIQQKGRSWVNEEMFARDEMIPVGARIEIHNGKLLSDDEARLTLLAMLLENLGLDKAINSIDAIQEAFDQNRIEEGEGSGCSGIYTDVDDAKKIPPIPTTQKTPNIDDNQKTDDVNSWEPGISPTQSLKKYMDDYLNNPVRYVIHYPPLGNVKLYLNVENDSCSNDINTATVFRDLSAARAVVDVYDDSSLHIAQISVNKDKTG